MRGYQSGLQCECLPPTSSNEAERGVQAQEMDEAETEKARELKSASVSTAPWTILKRVAGGDEGSENDIYRELGDFPRSNNEEVRLIRKNEFIINLPAIPRFEDMAKPIF